MCYSSRYSETDAYFSSEEPYPISTTDMYLQYDENKFNHILVLSLYRVTKVVGDTVFVDFSTKIAPLALAGGDFKY